MSEPVFINPAPYGNFKYKHSKSVELLSSPNTKIVSPYDGVVIYDYTPMCEDSIKIMHTFDEKVIYSVFCGIKRPYVKYNDEVKQGSTIGKFLDDKVKYYIVDEDDEKQEIPTFFSKKLKIDKEKKSDKTTKNQIEIQSREYYKNFFMAVKMENTYYYISEEIIKGRVVYFEWEFEEIAFKYVNDDLIEAKNKGYGGPFSVRYDTKLLAEAFLSNPKIITKEEYDRY